MNASASFLLARTDRHVVGNGCREHFDSSAAALDALHARRHTGIVGALPFDTRHPAALIAPETLRRHVGPWTSDDAGAEVSAHIGASDPPAAEHIRRITKVLDVLANPSDELAKVVLARAVGINLDDPVTPWWVAARLADRDPGHHAFVADLSPAGGQFAGRHLVGASPEVLIRKDAMTVSCHPLAGSAPRGADPAADRMLGRELAESAKDRREHRYVVDALIDTLGPLCSRIEVPDEPELVTTPRMWHLGTPIRGELHDRELTSLDLALAVHPTPAVCGTPTGPARDTIELLEGDRRFYGGAVGWSHRDTNAETDDGEWLVAIRCAELAADGRSAVTWAGGGIVDGSDPDAELAETTAKFRTVLDAFGITDQV